jgi:hypothetical protein
MEVARISTDAINAILSNYTLIVYISILILIFAVYVYLFPTPFSEYFTDKAPRKYPQTSIE